MDRADFQQSEHVTDKLAPPINDLNGAYGVIERLRGRLRAAVSGRDAVIEVIITAMLADGHILLEDYPGSGKTTLAKALGDSIVDDNPNDDIVTFRRIQFTPDLLPSDVTGTTIFDPNTNKFFFRPGPIFAHVVLADEINRTSPKVQSAMLEAMAEKQTTTDNRTRKLDDFFFVMATQNPLDLAGTFPLPSAQLDRFLFKVKMSHISRQAELDVLANYKSRRTGVGSNLPRVTRTELLDSRRTIEHFVHVAPEVRECLVDIAGKTRSDPRVLQGASTRSLVLAIPALQVHAVANQRNFVNGHDVHALASLIFAHRVEVAPGSDSVDAVLKDCMTEPLESLARATMQRRKMSFRRALATVCLTAGLVLSPGGDETAIAQQQSAPIVGNALENEAYKLLKDNKLLTARTKADQILEKDPDSILGNYVLGCVLREAEGDLARAMYRLGRARELFERRYGANPPPSSPWAFHRELLFETQVLAGEMEEYEYQLQILDFHDALYDPKLVAEHAWPLLRLGKFDQARKIARTAAAASDRGQQSLGRNALCAIEGEARQRKPYFDACMDALEGAKKAIKSAQTQPNQPAGTKELPSTRDAIPVVHDYNAALAAYSVLRFDEVERLAKEGTGGRPLTIANPWRILTRLYTDGGRAAEAVASAREMQSWRAHQLANLRDQDRAETDAVLASLLLVAGETEPAERLIQRAIERPDRRGLVSSKPDQALGAHALLRRAIAKTRAEQLSERASWSGTKDRSKKATSAIATRIASWPEDERIVSILSDGSRLDSTFRMFLSGGIEPVPSWLVSDLVDIVGPGVVSVVLEKVRSEEKGFDLVKPYYDAIEAEVAFRRGDEQEAIEIARRAISGLPKGEGLLSARVAAIGAEAARKHGDHAAEMALFEQALQKDAARIRRLGFSIPARVTGAGDGSVGRAVTLLGRSPRLRDDKSGFVVSVEKGGGVLRACLKSPGGATLSCSTAAPVEKEAPDDWAARLVELFHRDAFALRVGLTTRDLNSLDGSTTAASQGQREQMNGVLKGLADDAPKD